MDKNSDAILEALRVRFETITMKELFARAFVADIGERKLSPEEEEIIDRHLEAYRKEDTLPAYVLTAAA